MREKTWMTGTAQVRALAVARSLPQGSAFSGIKLGRRFLRVPTAFDPQAAILAHDRQPGVQKGN